MLRISLYVALQEKQGFSILYLIDSSLHTTKVTIDHLVLFKTAS